MQRSAGPRGDMTQIVDRIFAHKQYRKRNFVVTCLIEELFQQEPRLMAELKPILTELTNLVKQENSSVCLKARTILIACEKPTFDIRYSAALRSATQGKGEFTMEYSRYAPAAVETQDKVVDEYKKKQEQEAGPQKGKKKKN